VDNLRKAEREVGRRCRVLMDIAGPKLRTGKLEPGPQVMKIKPPKDEFGRVTAPARLMLVPHGKPSLEVLEGHQSIEVSPSWLKRLRDGTQVVFRDSRGSRRAFTVVGKEGTSVVVECGKTAYVDATTKLKVVRGEKTVTTAVYNIPHLENPILLKKGESVVVTASQKEGCGARRGSPARVPCTLPEALRFVKVGERIWFDDGKIGGVVRSASKDELRVEITSAGIDGSKLREDKGINLPDTDLRLPALTAKDYEDLGFIAKNADMVGYSFVRTSADLGALRRELEKLGREDTGVVLKIESARSFEQLPSLLLESIRGPSQG